MDSFTSVVFDPAQGPIAQVNRADGTLYLKPQIWDTLPQEEKNFVLWHEKGHLVLQTTDEFKCNEYAVKHYVASHDLTNPELKKRITVMQTILTPGRENPAISGFTAAVDPVSAVSGAIGSIFTTLPLLGIGSGARQAETAANAAAQSEIIAATAKANAAKNQTNLIYGIIGGAFLIVIIVLYFIFRKK